MRTFINYLLATKTDVVTQTSALANTRAQPVRALKDAVNELCAYLLLLDSSGHLSLEAYSDYARPIQDLTSSFNLITQATYLQQAGGYGTETNIAAGINQGITRLTSSSARKNAKKVIFIITDGNPTIPDPTSGATNAINSATTAAQSKGIQIYTITLGSDVDQSLMGQIADIGKGIHYHVPTLNIQQYSDDLKNVFRTLGGKRPVQLIQ
ncbi:MAG: vWA domain-containing protein [Phycisphaerae bacterium]